MGRRTAVPRGSVLLAGPGLVGLLSGLPPAPPPCRQLGWDECRGLIDWGLSAAALAGPRLRRLVEGLGLRRIIYLGVDGSASRALGEERVLEPYGSVLRARCGPGCPRPQVEGGPGSWRVPGCPRGCGQPPAPDAAALGEPPRPRVLDEAVYEATTAPALLVCCLGMSVLGEVLALTASRFTRLVVVGRDPVASWAASSVVSLEALLGEAGEDEPPVDQ